jgi:hypothetical protein
MRNGLCQQSASRLSGMHMIDMMPISSHGGLLISTSYNSQSPSPQILYRNALCEEPLVIIFLTAYLHSSHGHGFERRFSIFT